MKSLVCGPAIHAAAKSTPAWWQSLELVGYQDVPAGETADEPAYRMEVRLCTCGSSISRTVEAQS